MGFEPSSVLEVLRNQVHTPGSDPTEIHALLYAIGGRPGYEIVWDYAVDRAAAQIAAGDAEGWGLLHAVLAASPTQAHPRLPDGPTITRALAQAPVASRWVVRVLAVHARSGGVPIREIAERLGAYALGLSAAAEPRGEAVAAVVECATALLASLYAENVVASREVAEHLCAFLRGVESWNARRHALSLFGEALAMEPGLAHEVFSAFLERLSVDGAPYLQDRARSRTIGMREVRYAPLSAFAQVAMPAAAVADLLRHRPHWSPARATAVARRLWEEAAAVMDTCGVILPTWPQTGPATLDRQASLQGPNGDLARQCALAAAESLLAIGEAPAAVALVEVVQQVLDDLGAARGYGRWSADLAARARAAAG